MGKVGPGETGAGLIFLSLYYTDGKGQVRRIFSGSTSDNTIKNLTESIRNFRYIVIVVNTNIEYDTIFLPTKDISNSVSYTRTMMETEGNNPVTIPYAYQSTANIRFPTDTTVRCKALYNNVNWILKLVAIYGIR
jgi:hypothetical protein